MSLTYYLNKMRGVAKVTRRTGALVTFRINRKKMTLSGLALLRAFLNAFEAKYFIVYQGLPFCCLPDATDHIFLKTPDSGVCLKDKRCMACLFVHECPGWPGDLRFSRESFGPIKDVPREVVFEITDKCNLDCLICGKKRDSKNLFLDPDLFKKILEECSSLDIGSVRFTGGEPMLHPRILEMLDLAKSKGFYVLLNTNATLFTEGLLKKIEGSVDNILVSLQGYDQRSNNLLTGSKEDFSKKLKNIRMIARSRIPWLQVGTVISTPLLENFQEYLELIRMLEVRNWLLFRPMAGLKCAEYSLGKKQLLRLMRQIRQAQVRAGSGLNIKIANPVPFCVTDDLDLALRTLSGGSSDDGHSRIVLDARGYFKPSYFIDHNLGASVRQAWNDRFIKEIRTLSYLPSRCQKCFFKKWCKGGSYSANDYLSKWA